jgi:NAD(P)-dependent dehydrogenase (short-subunit alcohol dehydrogenase family)
MTTLVVCIKRNPKLSRAEFSRYWREKHGPLLAACTDFTRHLKSYFQHHLNADDTGQSAQFGVVGDFDGIAILDFHHPAAMALAFAEPRYLSNVQPDEARFVDISACVSYVTEAVSVVAPPSNLFRLDGKTAVVTGGAKGVGAMIATALADAGAKVIVVSRDGVLGRSFADALPGEAVFLSHDLTSIDGVRAAAADIAVHAPALHILVNNAGIFSAGPIDTADSSQWDREMGLNVRAPFFLAQSLMLNLKAASIEGDPARIVNIGSIGGLWGKSSGGAYAYGASKAAIHQLTRMMASDLTPQGITVNAIAPGFFPSDMTDGFFSAVPGMKDAVIGGIPAGRLGTPEDIGGAAIFVCSRAGAYVSGAVIPVEGALWQA